MYVPLSAIVCSLKVCISAFSAGPSRQTSKLDPIRLSDSDEEPDIKR